jgi:hypothetical protein
VTFTKVFKFIKYFMLEFTPNVPEKSHPATSLMEKETYI